MGCGEYVKFKRNDKAYYLEWNDSEQSFSRFQTILLKIYIKFIIIAIRQLFFTQPVTLLADEKKNKFLIKKR